MIFAVTFYEEAITDLSSSSSSLSSPLKFSIIRKNKSTSCEEKSDSFRFFRHRGECVYSGTFIRENQPCPPCKEYCILIHGNIGKLRMVDSGIIVQG